MVHYDPMELSELLMRLKDSQKKGTAEIGTTVYKLLNKHCCDWDSMLEERNLDQAVPVLFVGYEDLPLMINRITDQEDQVILRWRFDLGK
jgi:hypothetical protein